MRGMSDELALLAAAALVGLWLALFFLGHTAGGLLHLMPVAAGVLGARIVRRPKSDSRRELP
jgi:hypothetical protein